MRSAYRGPDVRVGFSELLPYPLGQSRHGVFGGTVEMLIGTRHHPVAPHTGAERRAQLVFNTNFIAALTRTRVRYLC